MHVGFRARKSRKRIARDMLARYSTPKIAMEMAFWNSQDYKPHSAGRRHWGKVLKQMKSNPPQSLMQLGRVVNIELDNGSLVTPSTKLILAWGNRQLVICKPARGNPGTLSPNVRDMHRKFHGVEPRGAVVADCPTPSGKLTKLGLIKAITYQATGINSPAKKRHNWRHLFGDTGHEGRENHPPSLMPALMQDSRGNVFIKRRAGNKYTVDVYDDGEAYISG